MQAQMQGWWNATTERDGNPPPPPTAAQLRLLRDLREEVRDLRAEAEAEAEGAGDDQSASPGADADDGGLPADIAEASARIRALIAEKQALLSGRR